MKATGIVRRIDDLGRVVIPKEIRRTLRIKEGDPLELFTTREGEVVFKKYSYTDEHDWAKAKAIVKALYPDLQFALYDHWGEKQTSTKVGFSQSIEFADFDDREIKNNEGDTIGYIEVDSDILTEELEKVIKILKEFFSNDL